jgi:hypothetical protein
MSLTKSPVLNGYTLKELTDTYRYDPEEGKLYSVVTGKSVGYTTHRGYFVSKRTVHKVTSLRMGPLCWFLYYKELPEQDVKYKDGNIFNLRIDNLFVAQRGTVRDRANNRSNTCYWIETIEDRILYSEFRNLWCVRRGKKDSVYWAKSLEEAIFVRNEYLSGKNPQRRDFYQAKYQ